MESKLPNVQRTLFVSPERNLQWLRTENIYIIG